MKVLHILNELRFSGAEVMLVEAAPVFTRSRIDLHILTTGATPGPFAGAMERAGYSIHHIPFNRSPGYLFRIYRFVRRGRFDVVHLHPERAFFWHSLAARFGGAGKILRTVHSVFRYEGYLRWKRLFQRLLARKILKVSFISIGSSVFKCEMESFRNETTLVWNWVDQDKYVPPVSEEEKVLARQGFGIDSGTFVMVSVGSCDSGKNHKDVISALGILMRKIGGVAYLHVGDGPLLEEEREFARSHGLGELIRFTGQIQNVRDALIAADVFVMTSRHEGLSRASLEALSCGLPAVVYNVDGLRDAIDEGENGFIVDPRPEALASRVWELIRNGPGRRRMAAQARNKVLQSFSMEHSVGRLTDLYGVNK